MVVLRISISYAVRAYENMLIDTGINNKFRLKNLSICSTISMVRRCKIAYKMDSSVGTINLCALRLLHACTRKAISVSTVRCVCGKIIMYSRHVFTLPFRNENILLYRMSLEGKFLPMYNVHRCCRCHLRPASTDSDSM